jgi:hypothetical protein
MADKELGYMVQWTNEEKPGHRELRIKMQKAFSIRYAPAPNKME